MSAEGAGEAVIEAAQSDGADAGAIATAGAAAAAGGVAVELVDASKWYGEVIGVNQVTLSLGQGVTGLLGPNGAGKSTLLKLITGQLKPGRGKVRVFGGDPWSDRDTFRRMGYCPDAENLYEDMTALEFATLMGRLAGYGGGEAARRAAERLELVGLEQAMRRRIRGFSKGMRQRTKLAAALLHDPDLLVLDEPLNGLDPAGRMEMLELFRAFAAEGCSVIVSSHILHEVESLDPRVALMARGRLLAEGRIDEIRALIDSQPLTLRIETAAPRAVARALAELETTVSLEVATTDAAGRPLLAPGAAQLLQQADRPAPPVLSAANRHSVTVRTTRPDDICEAIQQGIMREQFPPVVSLTAIDENLEAVFSYLTT